MTIVHLGNTIRICDPIYNLRNSPRSTIYSSGYYSSVKPITCPVCDLAAPVTTELSDKD